eukprot:TRINITY_DN6007_c0_g1_i1.p1 TRINITY_DN6007_c0_g1~~TRINITY_DN6007_c0_g1_i1.p1  ORF type:complete len:292 (+),score=55.30 TRINITY_DN6007_c0_g1_i1:90-965(+)
MSIKDITPNEKKFCNDAMKSRGDRVIFHYWVEKKKKHNNNKTEKRLLVFGKYRMLSIAKTLTGKKVIKRDGHYWDLKNITSLVQTSAVITFNDWKIGFECDKVGNIIQSILTTTKSIFYNFPKDVLYEQKICSSVKIVIKRQESVFQTPIGGGLLEIYSAACSYFEVPIDNDVIEVLKNEINTSTTLHLGNIPGINNKGSNRYDVGPLFHSLKYNNYFTEIKLSNVHYKELLTHVSEMMQTNSTIQHLELVNLDLKEGYTEFSNSLKSNVDINLTSINFSIIKSVIQMLII